MSFAIFEVQKYIIEKYISEYRDFLSNKLKLYNIEEPDMEMLNEYKEKVQEQLEDKHEKSIEDCMKFIVTDGWEMIFKADNIIDTDKTLEEQSRILQDTIFSLNANSVLDNKHFPVEVVDIINKNFLCDGYKFYVLKALLVSEYNLCNPNISYIDAICERVRIMYYSGLLVANMDKVEDLLELINKKEAKVYIPRFIINLLKLPIINDFFPKIEQLSTIDLLYASAICSIICAPSDDFMDLEEDLQNNKITGITQAIKQNVDPKMIMATTIKFLKNKSDDRFPEFKKWAIHVMILLYKDSKKCFEFCKSISPEYFDTIFQRKASLQ
jgi:hypothetical protein